MAIGDPPWEQLRWEERIKALEAKVAEPPPSQPSDKAKIDRAIKELDLLVDVMQESCVANTITLDHDWGYRMGTLLKELKS